MRKALYTSVSLLVFLCPAAATAQAAQSAGAPAPAPQAVTESETSPDAQQSANSDGTTRSDIVVTGSRAASAGYQASTPTTVIGSDLVNRQGATSIAQVLNQDPAFKPVQSPGSNNLKTATPGSSTADLRGLGGQRTLVLVNGMRVVPVAPTTNTSVAVTTDLNLIPSLMIDRVEVVTGGASAQWGSDAVAGVVNIRLKRSYEGIMLKAQTGISQRGDDADYRIGGIAGFNFAGGAGRFVAGVDYESSAGLGDIYTRAWGRKQYQIISNPARTTNGLTALLSVPGVNSALGAGGTITGPANFAYKGYTFDPDGTPRPFQSGSITSGVQMIGGEGRSVLSGFDMAPAVDRVSSYSSLEYDLSDRVTARAEFSYGWSKGEFDGSAPRLTGLTIQRDNAFLPTEIGDAMDAAHITSFGFQRSGFDLGSGHIAVTNKIPRGTLSLLGQLGGGWSWDLNGTMGRDEYRQVVSNATYRSNLLFALDAVVNPANNQIVCRATLPGPSYNAAAAGCVPLNLFGEGQPSAAAIAYVQPTAVSTSRYDQQVVTANMKGKPFSTWAGPVSVAFGGEYRHEKQVVQANALAASGGFLFSGNATPYSGSFHVAEAYLDTIVPLARDWTFAKSIDFNGAVRYADYSTVGSQVTWKGGLTWEPIDLLRFRVTRSRDIRAPAIYELAGGGQLLTNTATVHGVTTNIPQNTTLGNPDLRAEKADTFTAGVVLEPGGGFHASVDYYDIRVKDAIASLSAATIASQCDAGNQTFCNFFTFNSAGAATSLYATVLNIGSFRTKGLDIAADYQRNLGHFLWAQDAKLTLSARGTYVFHALVNTGSGIVIDRAGENTEPNLGAAPHFRGNFSETLDLNPWSFTLQQVFVSKGTVDNTYNTLPTNTINDNTIPAVVYMNLYTTFDVGKKYQLFFAVDNLLDLDPPLSPYPNLPTPPVNGQYYDKVGRAFRVGVTVRL